MLRFQTKFSFVTALAPLALIPLSMSLAIAGGTSSGGGNSIASHVYGIAKRTGGAYTLVCSGDLAKQPDCKHLNAYQEALGRAKILQKLSFPAEHAAREAMNDAKETIELNIPRWKEMFNEANSRERQVRVTIHELMGIAGVEKSGEYFASNSVLALLKSNMIDISVLAGTPPVATEGNGKPQPGQFGYNEYMKNPDGTVTIVMPFVYHQSKWRLFKSYGGPYESYGLPPSDQSDPIGAGICIRAGYKGGRATAEGDDSCFERERAIVTSEGQIKALHDASCLAAWGKYIKAVTCTP